MQNIAQSFHRRPIRVAGKRHLSLLGAVIEQPPTAPCPVPQTVYFWSVHKVYVVPFAVASSARMLPLPPPTDVDRDAYPRSHEHPNEFTISNRFVHTRPSVRSSARKPISWEHRSSNGSNGSDGSIHSLQIWSASSLGGTRCRDAAAAVVFCVRRCANGQFNILRGGGVVGGDWVCRSSPSLCPCPHGTCAMAIKPVSAYVRYSESTKRVCVCSLGRVLLFRERIFRDGKQKS